MKPPFRIMLNTAKTAAILTDSEDTTLVLQREAKPYPYESGSNRIGLTYYLNNRSQSIDSIFSDWKDMQGNNLGANQFDTLVALSELTSFKVGGSAGAVTSVNEINPIENNVTVDLDSVLSQNNDSSIRAKFNNSNYVTENDLVNTNVIIVNQSSLDKLPAPVANVISIPTLTTIIFEGEVDITPNRLSFEKDCAILGTTSETSYLKSTLPNNVPLITSVGSLPIQNISLEVLPAIIGDIPYLFELNGILETGAALDWFGVNCLNSKIGNIKNYGNFVATLCAFIETKGGFVFDGVFDSIVFENSIFRGDNSIGTHIKVNSTTNIARRIRIEKTPIIAIDVAIGLDISTSATIPVEGLILRYVNFSGGGFYLQGLQPNDNKAIVEGCRGIANSGNISEYFMVNNATATTITAINTFVKIAGTTSAGSYIQRFTLANNRATYTGAITRFFLVQSTMSMTAGNNQLLIARIAKNGVTIASSESQTTTSNAGRSENVKCQTIVQLSTNDYIEVFVANGNINNVTVSELNTIITPLS